jgi:hypothetical protein
MAKIVGGFGTSHTPLMSLPGTLWTTYAQGDPRNGELITVPAGKRVSYDELLAQADPRIRDVVNEAKFIERANNIQAGLDEVQRRFVATDPDVVVMIGDDQSEWFFNDNYPTINVYWGDSVKLIPRTITPQMDEARKVSALAYGSVEKDYPVDSKLGLHIIESLMDQDFDIAQSQYQSDAYGGSIGPATWYLDKKRSTPPRRFGLPHAFGFPIARWFGGKDVPIVPVTINTCYPPNWISPRRAYALGQGIRRAVESWETNQRVAIACSGGLSHFVVDEELDRIALKGLEEANGEILSALPRHRLQSATTETLNWVAVAGAMAGTGMDKMETITYEPCYRTPAGTGCGSACGTWL